MEKQAKSHPRRPHRAGSDDPVTGIEAKVEDIATVQSPQAGEARAEIFVRHTADVMRCHPRPPTLLPKENVLTKSLGQHTLDDRLQRDICWMYGTQLVGVPTSQLQRDINVAAALRNV